MDKKGIVKIVAAWILYVALHMTYKFFPCGFTRFLGCPEETLYVHMKMAFFSYLIINICFYVYGLYRGKKEPVLNMLLANCIYPYLSFFIWMLVPAVFGQLQQVVWEVLYSNVILVICLIMTVSFENGFSGIKWGRLGRAAVIFFFAVSLLLFVVMTAKKPAIEMFEAHGHGQEHK